MKRTMLFNLLALVCLFGIHPAFAQKKEPPIKTKLKPTVNMAVVQLHIQQKGGKPLANHPIMVVEGGARNTKSYGKTDEKGVVEFLVRNRRNYRLDFMGAARPKMLFVPNKPHHRFRVNVLLNDANPANLFIHMTDCKTGKALKNYPVKIQGTQKGIVYQGNTDKQGVASFRIKLGARYTVVVDSAAYPIHPKTMVHGTVMSDVFSLKDLNFNQQFRYHYQNRCPPPPPSTYTSRSSNASGIDKVFKRNKDWKNALVVLSGGWFSDHFKMYKEFLKGHNKQNQTQMIVCSHCKICEPYDQRDFKPIIPKSTNPKVKLVGIVQGDLLSIFQGFKQNPKAKEVVLLTARNHISPQEKKFFSKIKVPVRIVLVNVQQIHPGYLALAKATGGSIHTIKADISEFSKLVPGQTKIINGVKYKLVNKTNFKVVK
ncbi:MAG TPA: hypothetical protein DCS93_19660 [Microscillaceae bacterium]|nr:hypothetical protein [Microscillaceae bacterium]